ncbi:hypothetical protein DDB_G0267318 [Dictyostelium discoideum AX4]|uniref:Uncharacterized protein n=1 Tax=Dictyostelium discoideum TaxID=44689 RepID=Q55GZ8_DICDI|nr:hypothetical protein DDB_G0267318 [Dictyostelium discoideum AX4]EAL73796.1 hypothetical protein DDB_G0267318 [Dictyostelium discoideum AX4]|eukprot:XP_647720.1 hypothetical protein DDB_G0267318 [Dictyostelium discoideum AX4]
MTSTTTIDYDAIEKSIAINNERSAANNLGGTKACQLRELFTIGLSGSR